MSRVSALLKQFYIWRLKHIKHRQFVLILSLVIGLLSGLAAVLLKNTVHFTSTTIISSLEQKNAHYLFLMYPFIGILLTVIFIKYFVKDNLGHGISRVLYAISKQSSLLKSHNNYSSLIASTLTVGFGGSVGLEAPIVLTGSSIGSNIGRLFKQNYKTTTLLVGCGAAGAIAGIFKAPIAAVIFGLEVLMLDLTLSSLVPLLISAVTGAMVSYFFLGKGVIFNFSLSQPFVLHDIPFYIILGILAGFVSIYFTKGTFYLESQIGRIKKPYTKVIIGGILLGLLIFLFPPLYGEGYETLREILNGQANELTNGSLLETFNLNTWILVGFLFFVLLFKVFASSITSASGGVGGIFAPALFMGGITGFLTARIINVTNFVSVSEKNFALVGMAGVMAGIMHAPLTAIFLIAEITGGYQLFIPLIIASTIAYLTVHYFESYSIYTKRLADRGELLTHNKDKSILQLIDIKKVIEKDFRAAHPDATLGEFIKVISKSKRNIFPVYEEDKTLIGIVLLENVREIMFNRDMYNEVKVSHLMIAPPTFIYLNDSMETVVAKFQDTDAWNLPVVDDKNRYVGFISKSKLFSIYRKWLQDISMT